MLGEPPLVARLDRGDAQGVALLAEQGVAAVAGAERPDLACLREVADVLRARVAGPGRVGGVLGQRGADRVQAPHELSVRSQRLEHRGADPRHDVHAGDDVGRVRHLDSHLGNRRADGPHAVGNHVEGAALHGAAEELGQRALHLGRVAPVIGRPRVTLLPRADEGELLHARDVGRVGADEDAVGTPLAIEPDGGSRLHEQPQHQLVLVVRAVAPHHALGLAHGGRFLHPDFELPILGHAVGLDQAMPFGQSEARHEPRGRRVILPDRPDIATTSDDRHRRAISTIA